MNPENSNSPNPNDSHNELPTPRTVREPEDKFADLNAAYERYKAARDAGQSTNEAIEALYYAVRDQAKDVVGKVTRRHPDKDLVMTATEEVTLSIDSYKGLNNAKFSTWSEQVIRYICADACPKPVDDPQVDEDGLGGIAPPEIAADSRCSPVAIMCPRLRDEEAYTKINPAYVLYRPVIVEDAPCQRCGYKMTRMLSVSDGIVIPNPLPISRCAMCSWRRANVDRFQPHAFEKSLNNRKSNDRYGVPIAEPFQNPNLEGHIDPKALLFVAQAQDILSLEDRYHLQLRMLVGLTAKEIAVKLGVSVPAVWKRWQRIIDTLHKNLVPECQEPPAAAD